MILNVENLTSGYGKIDVLHNISMKVQRQVTAIVGPKMTVLENLMMGLYIIDDKKQIKRSLMAVFEKFPMLKERRNQSAGSLSGGERRMLELGRALLLRPKLILLDEPSLGLAPKIVEDVFQKIEQIKKEETKIIIVEQNVKKALSISDYVYVLDLGKIAFDGKPEEILSLDRLKSLYLGS